MKITININRGLMKELGPYCFFVLSYYEAFHKSKGKYPSINLTRRDLGISFGKVKEALFRASEILPNYNSNSFNKVITNNNYINNNTARRSKNKKMNGKMQKQEKIWNEIILPRIPKEELNGKNSKFYYRIGIWMNNLLKSIEEDSIPVYVDWFVSSKLKSVSGFNAGIMCCDGMINEFKGKGADFILSSSRKEITKKKGEFEREAGNEEKKFLKSILEKKKRGEKLDELDTEALRYFQEINLYNGEEEKT